jgi:hypothetical protein
MAAKVRSGPVLDELGGQKWMRTTGLRTDATAGVGFSGSMALAREADSPAPNRAVVVRLKEGGFRVEYWRVDGEDGEQVAEKIVADGDAVKAELTERFAA